MASTVATATKTVTLGTLYAEIDRLKDDALEVFSAHENDASISTIRDIVSQIESRAFRLGAALSEIESGLNQL